MYKTDLNYTLSSQPTIYNTEKLKCKYAGRFVAGVAYQDWGNYKLRVAARDREWDYDGYLEMHQEQLNPKHLRQFSTTDQYID